MNSDGSFLSVAGAGMWLLQRFKSQLSKYQSSFTVEATISTRGEDWSYYGALQNRSTGQYADTSSILSTAMALPYSYGIIYPPGGTDNKKGLIRVGPHQTTSFASLFPGVDATTSPSS